MRSSRLSKKSFPSSRKESLSMIIDTRNEFQLSQFHHCCLIIRNLITVIKSKDIPKAEILKNLENTVEIMDAIVTDEEIDLNEEDDLHVNTELVPVEIRDWITATFSTTANRAPRESKPKFRTVANVIRAGIMVENQSDSSRNYEKENSTRIISKSKVVAHTKNDKRGNSSFKINLRLSIKMFKRSNEIVTMKIPEDITRFLKTNINLWSFEIFELDDMSGGHSLRIIGLDLFLRHNIFHKFKVKVPNYENLLSKLESGYSKFNNPYHNLVHGADVAQTCHYIVHNYQLKHWLTDLEIFAIIFAALIHDYEHTGTTNNFHINTTSELTLLYNDRGVLENHHVSSVFRIMQDPDHDILSAIPKDDHREFRSLVIEMVLSTDMSHHFKQMKNMKSHISLDDGVDKGMGLSMILHCADISHPGKHWDLHYKWTMQLLEEFFRQGDQERELNIPFSPLCDRKTILIPDSQIGFSNFIVDPSFQILGSMLELIVETMKKQGLNIQIQTQEIKKIIDEDKILDSMPPFSGSKSFQDHHPWERHVFFNRSIWQRKLEQEKETKSSTKNNDAVSHM